MQKTKVYVRNLNFNVDESTLSEFCGRFGTVTHTKIIKDHDTLRSRGFAFVTYESEGEAQSAISGINGSELEGRVVYAEEAVDKRNAPVRINS